MLFMCDQRVTKNYEFLWQQNGESEGSCRLVRTHALRVKNKNLQLSSILHTWTWLPRLCFITCFVIAIRINSFACFSIFGLLFASKTLWHITSMLHSSNVKQFACAALCEQGSVFFFPIVTLTVWYVILDSIVRFEMSYPAAIPFNCAYSYTWNLSIVFLCVLRISNG